jgi:hypothetical protein
LNFENNTEKFFDTKNSLLFFGANEDDLNTLEKLILPSKISDSKLMHLRLEGKIKFKKDGRSFYYLFI